MNTRVFPDRNERLVKNAQKQLEYDGRLPPPQKRQSIKQNQAHEAQQRKSQNKGKSTTENPRSRGSKSHVGAKRNEDIYASQRDEDGLPTFRFDAVFFVILMTQIIGIVAIALEVHVYFLDQYWNQVLESRQPLNEITGHNAFREKTYKFEGHDYLEHAKRYAIRDEPQEIAFIVLIAVFIFISIVHVFACYIKTEDFERFSAMLISLYAIGGGVCIFSSLFLISSATSIENNYEYAADMLYNFQHVFDNDTRAYNYQPADADCSGDIFIPGCAKYEYAKKVTGDLEAIFRICGAGSRFTRFRKADNKEALSVKILGEVYRRSDLKEIGFCSRDGFKLMAATFAVIAGILSSIVPIIYCCETKSTSSRESYLMAAAVEDKKRKSQLMSDYLPAANLHAGKNLFIDSIPDEQKRHSKPGFNEELAIKLFRTYVEKDSDNEPVAQALKAAS